MEYKMLFSPLNIGSVTIKNRIVMSPMMLDMGQFDGTATKRLQDYYEERAKGGTGLIITEITRVNDWTGAGAFAQLGASRDYQIPSLRELAGRIHRHGAKIFVELHHPGRQNVGLLLYTVPFCAAMQKLWPGFPRFLYSLTPKAGPWLVEKKLVPAAVCPSRAEPSYVSGGRVRALTRGEIRRLIGQFADAAERVQKAGCDGVELHAAHGYLIQQFLSPYTNRRTDEYGGSLENRMRFLEEIIRAVRARCGPAFPIVVRLSVDECYDRIGRPGTGYGLDEGVAMARRLEKMGIDAIDVSSAAYDTFNYWLEPTSFPCGWRKHMARAVKEAVSIPVIAANLIRSPEQAEEQLEEGDQDFISLGRPHIADPHWAEKVESGREDDVKRCICCCYCIESMMKNAYLGTPAQCAVNPRVGREAELNTLPHDGGGRLCVVAGAGPAGLTAAEVLTERGFRVIVLEKEPGPGGLVSLAGNHVPDKEKLTWVYKDLEHTVLKNGGEIRCNTPATAETIRALEPYAVFVATGGAPVLPRSIPGLGGENVCTPNDVLSGRAEIRGKQVAVIGSGLTGLEVAELLATQGNKVFVVEMAKELAPGTWMQHPDALLPRLRRLGVSFSTNEKLVEVTADGILTESMYTHNKALRPVDRVVVSLGLKPENALCEALKDLPRVYAVGDAVKQGRIANATRAAFDAAAGLR